MSILDRIKRAAALTLRAVEFGYYHVLLSTVDRVSRLPRNTTVPEAMRLYRENIALKAQLEVLEAELKLRMKQVMRLPSSPWYLPCLGDSRGEL